MGFFKDFKDDLSEAVDELIPGSAQETDPAFEEELAVTPDTFETDLNVEDELSKLDGLLEQAAKNVSAEEKSASDAGERPDKAAADTSTLQQRTDRNDKQIKESRMDTNTNETTTTATAAQEAKPLPTFESSPASDENAVITSGMKITGDLESTGSIEVEGTINGNVRCNGKLTVTGLINGNSTSAEFFADSAKVEGEVLSSGTVKIGVGSVVIGNISASSAVIAGAVKGDIDVQGPVVVDTSAVVMGNIKSRSVQINNGAVIEGFCSQAYAEVDVASVFG
ncbi:MAG: polymer-forming cytoskeletal protein [Lachnospiraceae bacterium]|nr:polymer-forming cytoskeletal protein [Lachnospiraceae bacterium]